MEIERLNDLTQRLVNENNALRHLRREKKLMYKKSKGKKNESKKSISSKYTSKKDGRYHKNAVPAKLKFRRQRTTYRTVYSASRRW